MRPLGTAQLLPLFAPVHVLILSVIVLPSLYVIWLSLSTSTFGQEPSFVGLANYIRVLTDPAFHSALADRAAAVLARRALTPPPDSLGS